MFCRYPAVLLRGENYLSSIILYSIFQSSPKEIATEPEDKTGSDSKAGLKYDLADLRRLFGDIHKLGYKVCSLFANARI